MNTQLADRVLDRLKKEAQFHDYMADVSFSTESKLLHASFANSLRERIRSMNSAWCERVKS